MQLSCLMDGTRVETQRYKPKHTNTRRTTTQKGELRIESRKCTPKDTKCVRCTIPEKKKETKEKNDQNNE